MPDYGNASPTLVALLRNAGMDPDEIREYLSSNLGVSGSGGNGSSSTDTGSTSPPFLSFDPALEAEQRALERGLENLLQDTARERKYAKKDAAQTIEDLEQDRKRGLGDIGQERHRGLRDIGTRKEDIQRDATRGREDFSTRLRNLIHNSAVQGKQQYQAANAAGVLDSSTQEASAAARAGNLARARAPIDTGLTRLNENEMTALEKLATTRGDLLRDTGEASHELRQDVRHDIGLTEQQLRRQQRDIKLRRQRAREEEAIGQVDLETQQIFDARERNPGVFDTEGNRKRKRDR